MGPSAVAFAIPKTAWVGKYMRFRFFFLKQTINVKIFSSLQDLPINMIFNAFIFKRLTFEPKDTQKCYAIFVEICINVIKGVKTNFSHLSGRSIDRV